MERPPQLSVTTSPGRGPTTGATLVDTGRLRSTLTTVVDHLDPAGLREAFGIADEGEAVGKVVLKG